MLMIELFECSNSLITLDNHLQHPFVKSVNGPEASPRTGGNASQRLIRITASASSWNRLSFFPNTRSPACRMPDTSHCKKTYNNDSYQDKYTMCR